MLNETDGNQYNQSIDLSAEEDSQQIKTVHDIKSFSKM